MCLILLAINAHPVYPLIIAANRDEFYARPSRPLDWWPEDQQLLGGQDLESCGSWLALTRSGQIAAVTNFREAGENIPLRPSRGDLTRHYLQQVHSDWDNWLLQNAQNFNGFNLLFGHWSQLKWFSNRSAEIKLLEPGIHGLCNSLLNTPWPKVERGKTLLQQTIKKKDFSPEDLMEILQDDHPAPDVQLPDTGIGLQWERLLSSIFIRSETYGTRASTVLAIDTNKNVEITERSWDPAGNAKERSIHYRLT